MVPRDVEAGEPLRQEGNRVPGVFLRQDVVHDVPHQGHRVRLQGQHRICQRPLPGPVGAAVEIRHHSQPDRRSYLIAFYLVIPHAQARVAGNCEEGRQKQQAKPHPYRPISLLFPAAHRPNLPKTSTAASTAA